MTAASPTNLPACVDLAKRALEVAELLDSRSRRLVLAESCTAGRVAALLGEVPGSSKHFCGSVVTYRDAAKVDLLGVCRDAIDRWTSVSEQVAAQMALGVLERTNEADYAASITGHLGPDAPVGQDGLVFIGLAWRENGAPQLYEVVMRRLHARERLERREEATELLLEQLAGCIRATTAGRHFAAQATPPLPSS
jgi:PncC family amidohydrolase